MKLRTLLLGSVAVVAGLALPTPAAHALLVKVSVNFGPILVGPENGTLTVTASPGDILRITWALGTDTSIDRYTGLVSGVDTTEITRDGGSALELTGQGFDPGGNPNAPMTEQFYDAWSDGAPIGFAGNGGELWRIDYTVTTPLTTAATDMTYTIPAGGCIGFPGGVCPGTSTTNPVSASLRIDGPAPGAGDIPFAPPSVISTPVGGPIAVFPADLNSDGHMDVVSAAAPGTIAWHENNGASPPVWTTRTISTAANGARSAFAADIDSDGDVDVLSASVNDDKIAWYENNGASPPVWTARTISTSADGAASVFAADIDSDGDIDVLSASENDDKIAWYENSGASPPTWTARTISTAADGAQSVFAADMDSDGDLDVLSASFNDNRIAWYENSGAAPPTWTARTISAADVQASSVVAADLDGDGDMDVLPASLSDFWYENNGASPPAWTPRTISLAGVANSVSVADLDADGDMDVLSASVGIVAWHANDGSTPPTWTARAIAETASGVGQVFAADMDSDGDLDVVASSSDIVWSENLTIHRSATFPAQSVISSTADVASSVFAADVDSDGDMDALSASQLDGRIAWYENNGALPPAWTARTITTAAIGASSVFAADVDGDGDVDALSASAVDDKIAWYESSGSSPPVWTARTISTAADGALSVFAADVDGDGDMDVLSASFFDNKIAWYENDGASPPAWTARTISTAMNRANSVFAADVDGDGDMDVLSASQLSDKISWYENNGASPPSWTDRTISTTADGAYSVFAADVDGDGDVDVLSASRFDSKIAWYENDGASPPAWTARTISTAAPDALSVFATDVDRDGDLDVLSASSGDDRIAWYENDGASPPAWTARTISTAADAASSVFAADVDSDGDVDVLSASFGDDVIAWYENRGGQFRLASADSAPAVILEGQRDDVLAVTATHKGRVGDTDLELASFDLLFEEAAGDPLTTGEANALVAGLNVYRDSGSGVFESGADMLVATVAPLALMAGRQAVAFADGDANAQVAFGTPRTFFVVAELTANAASQTPKVFRITHVTESTSTAEDRDHDVPLSLEFVSNLASRQVLAASLSSDADADGVLDVYETGTGSYVSPTNTGSDPLDADSDDDGFTDGQEVAAGSDPNDPDSIPIPIVPALGPLGAALLALALLAAASHSLRREPRAP